MTSSLFSRRSSVVVFGILLVAVAGCETRPGTVDRWANRPGSEERFLGYLRDPTLSLEVKERALYHIVNQWQHASRYMVDGAPLREMPDAAERDRLLLGVLPTLEERAASETIQRYHARDIAFHFSRGTDGQEVRDRYRQFLVSWTDRYWDPCRAAGGVPMRAVLEMIGEEAGAPFVAARIQGLEFAEVISCLPAQLSGLAWLPTSETVARAYTERWDAGRILTGESRTDQEAMVRYLELMDVVGPTDHMKSWIIERLGDPAARYGFFLSQILANHREPEDSARYLAALATDTGFRWMAFGILVQGDGAAGLTRALEALPASETYDTLAGQARTDGLRAGAQRICTAQLLDELRDDLRPVFERFAQRSDRPAAQALAVACLGVVGNANSVALLARLRTEQGRQPAALPGWAGGTLVDVIDAALQALQQG